MAVMFQRAWIALALLMNVGAAEEDARDRTDDAEDARHGKRFHIVLPAYCLLSLSQNATLASYPSNSRAYID